MLDIDYMEASRDFTNDPTKFPDLADLIQEFHDEDLQFTLIVVSNQRFIRK